MMDLTKFEHAVLSAIDSLGDNAYGTTIWRVVEQDLARGIAVGVLYKSLEKLHRDGLLGTRLGEGTPERGGRAKRYFWLNAIGVTALQEADAQAARVISKRMGRFGPQGGALGYF